jgi:Zn-dependent peptidase ImmA (M78 family)
MPSVNPEILRWARVTAGFSLEDAAAKLNLGGARGLAPEQRLADYEVGEHEPSRPLLVRMAKQYRRPLLTFYLTTPPRLGERGEDYRTLPPEHSRAQDAVLDALIRDLRARQEMIRAALEEQDEAVRLPFVASMSLGDGPEAVLQSIREALHLELDRYRGRQGRGREPSGFAYLRQQVEEAGIYVLLIGNLGSHHTTLDVEIFRGFALADDVAPLIAVNDEDVESAWSFTLLHEVCHVWLGATGVSGANSEATVEQFCNDVAGRFLLPSNDLAALRDLSASDFDNIIERINAFAEARSVSKSMVAYKLYREGLFDHGTWNRLSAFYRAQWVRGREAQRKRNREREGGPNYYVVRRHRLGNAIVSLARRMVSESAWSPSKAAKVLGVKASNVYTLVQSEIDPLR